MNDMMRMLYAADVDSHRPALEPMDLRHLGKVDEIVKAVMKRMESANAPGVTPEMDTGVTPFSPSPADKAMAIPLMPSPATGYEVPDEYDDPAKDLAPLYAADAATPFDGPQGGNPFEPGTPGPTIPISHDSYSPLQRALRPDFETYGRFGYPTLDSDPYARNLINTLRRMVRGAQA